MAHSFDGPNKIITLDSDTSVTVSEIYSRWKEWVEVSDNSKYLPAFRVVGGDPLGGGVQAGINVFLRNDYGWRIKPPEQDIQIRITGNLYAEDPDTPSFIPTVGGYDTLVRVDLSANLLQVASGGNTWSPATLMDDESIESGLTFRQALRLIAAATAGKVSGAQGPTVVFRSAVADDADRITATVDDDGNRTAIVVELD